MPTYKDEKTGTWFVKCYYTDYMGNKKQKKKRGFARQKDAKEWEYSFLSSLQYDSDTTFGSVSNDFIEENTPRRRKTTIRSYNIALKHILPTFKDIPLSEINEKMIILWQNELLNTELSEVYINKIDTMFRTIYKYGAKRCGLRSNPFDGIEKIGKASNKSLHFWTHEQYNAFIPYIEQPTTRMAFQVLYYCGIRIGELFALTAEDIDLDEQIMHITKSLQRMERQDVITPPKTRKGIRDITLPNFLVKELENYMSMIYDCNGETRLFEISKQSLYYPMKKYSEIARVPRIRIHDIRHSHVALLIEKGVSPLAIAERLGHDDIKITLGTYGHLYPNKQREIADLLNTL